MTRKFDPKVILKILRTIEKKPATFTVMVKKSGLARQTLNDYRKHLLEEGMIERNSITRTYALTNVGSGYIMEAEGD